MLSRRTALHMPSMVDGNEKNMKSWRKWKEKSKQKEGGGGWKRTTTTTKKKLREGASTILLFVNVAMKECVDSTKSSFKAPSPCALTSRSLDKVMHKTCVAVTASAIIV